MCIMMIPLKVISDCCDVTSGSLGGGGAIGAIKRPGGPSPVVDCFPLAKSDPTRVCVCVLLRARAPVCVHWGR